MTRPVFVIMRDTSGKWSAPYVGEDAEPAVKLMENPPAKAAYLEMHRWPQPYQRWERPAVEPEQPKP